MTDASADGLGRETLRRVSWRLLPFLMLACLACYIEAPMPGSTVAVFRFMNTWHGKQRRIGNDRDVNSQLRWLGYA